MAWYSWYHRLANATPKLNSYSNRSYETSYVSRYNSNGRYVYLRNRPSYSQTRSRQANLNEDSGVVTLGNRWNHGRVKEQASQYDDILESKGKSDAYYVRGRGYVAIDNDVAVEIAAKYDTNNSGLNWKIVKEYGLGAAKWYQAKKTHELYQERAEKYSNSTLWWERRMGARYQALVDRYKPIDNGDGTFEIQGDQPVVDETAVAAVTGSFDLKVLSGNSFQAEDGTIVTLNRTQEAGRWGGVKHGYWNDTLVGIQKDDATGGYKIVASKWSGSNKRYFEFRYNNGYVDRTDFNRGAARPLTGALEKEWNLDLDGSGAIGDAVIKKTRGGYVSTEDEVGSETLVADYTLDKKQSNTYRNTIEKTYTDNVLTNTEVIETKLIYSRDYGTKLTVKESSLYSPKGGYEYTQTKHYNGDISGTVGGLKYATGSGSWWYRNYNVTNQGLTHKGHTVNGDLNIDVDAINNFGNNYARTNVDGAYSTWLIGKDNSDTTINIDAKGTGAHTFESYRYNSVFADGLSYSRVATGSGDDTLTINAEAELNGLNRGYVTGYRDQALARGAERSSIQMGDGDDTLTIKARASSNIDRGRIGEYGIDRTKIEMGAGDDKVTIDTLTGQSARNSLIDMGEGNDVLTLGGRFDKLSDGNVFKGGDGFDTIVFNNLSETDFNNLSRQSFSFTPDKVTLGSTTFEGFEQVQIGDNISFKPSEITSTTQFTDIIKPEVFV